MSTTIREADAEAVKEAGAVIRHGGLVAFPTETVYGLGANALDAAAVRRIFEAKGRPASNPIIVHVPTLDAAAQIANVDETARRLMAAFWPGPLTLVMTKKAIVPDIVTAGGQTVAVRVPNHIVALALLHAAHVPIAAPSANRSEGLSPTCAEHVLAGLGDSVDMILDGGPSQVGLESTVLDVTVTPPRILRPGMVTAAQIEAVLGKPVDVSAPAESDAGLTARSPGQLPRHYAPKTPLKLSDDVWADAMASTEPVAVLAMSPRPDSLSERVTNINLPSDPEGYAAGLYASLHALDASGAALILVETPPETDEWLAIRDRLRRAMG